MTLNNNIEVALNNKKGAIVAHILAFAKSEHYRQYPWRQSNRSPYELLIAEVALKRTTATAAERSYLELLSAFPTPQELDLAPQVKVEQILKPLGLYKQRADSLKKLARYLVEHENNKIPSTLESLLKVPGVGQYTARAVLSFAFDKPAAIVDSNVVRVWERIFQDVLPIKVSFSTFQSLSDRILPRQDHRAFNLGLLDFGAAICRPVLPQCWKCPLMQICDYSKNPTLPLEVRQTNSPVSLKIRLLRKERGLSLVELAKISGLSKRTIVNIEAGRSIPQPATLNKLSKAFNIDVEQLVST